MPRALALPLLLAACLNAPGPFKDVCAQANFMVESCGATVPALTDAPCTGLARFVSQCVADHADSCDALAALMRSPDLCLPDGGDDVFPGAEELPFPSPEPLDAGATP